MKKIILGSLLLGLFLSACEKKVEPVDTFNVTVEYRSTGAKFVTGDVTLNPKDSIYFDFTISSPTDMSYIEIQKNGVRIDTFRLNSTNNRSFSLKQVSWFVQVFLQHPRFHHRHPGNR